jgi:flagellar protein FlaG
MSIQNIPSASAAMEAQFARLASQQAVTPQRAGDSATQATSAAEVRSTGSSQAPARGGNEISAEPDRETLLQAVEDVRKAIEPVAQNLLFSIDDDTGHTIVKVVDAQTDEVIRQMPSKEVLAISKAIDKLQGLLIQQKA